MNESPLSAYPTFVKGLVVNRATGIEGYLHAAVGMSGESGEVLDLIKKTWVSNKPLDTDKLKQEAGDILFYLQHLCNLMGVTLEEIAATNIAKLCKRYPNGYSDAASAARLDAITQSKQAASESYDMIDRFLHNNLDDEDYAEFSAALDSIYLPEATAQPGAKQ